MSDGRHKIEGISTAVLRAFEIIVGLDGVHIKKKLKWKERRLSAQRATSRINSLDVWNIKRRHHFDDMWQTKWELHLCTEDTLGFNCNSFHTEPCLWECSVGEFPVLYRNSSSCVYIGRWDLQGRSGVAACDITEELCQCKRKTRSRSEEDGSLS